MTPKAPAAIPDYNAIAAFYRKHWCGHNHAGLISMLRRLLLNRVRPGARLLDVCCGAGTVARQLVDDGFAVTGLDGASELIGFAREDVPEAGFFVADARDFQLDTQYEAALCTFDSLSYMTSQEDLERVFHCVGAALQPGGLFLFDISLEPTYRNEWQRSFSMVDDREACFIRGVYDERDRIGKTMVTRFVEDGGWRRTDVTFVSRCHAPEEIATSLRRAGFAEIVGHRSDEDEELRREIGPGRAAWVATKT